MSDKIVQVRAEVKAFSQVMERRARYGHQRANDEMQMVMPARFMSVAQMLAGAARNMEQVQRLALEAEQRHLGVAEIERIDNAAADSANYLRMAVEKLRAAEGA